MSGRMAYWYDLVTLRRHDDRGGHKHEHDDDHDHRGVLVRMPDNRTHGIRRANGTVVSVAAGAGVRIVDRSALRPGDVVAPESDVGGQIGVVTGVSRALDLARFDDDGAVVPSCVSRPPEEVRRVTGLVLGDYVVSGPWLGTVAEVSLDVDVAFDDGALCTVTAGAERELAGARAEEEDNRRYDLRNGRQTNSVLYPGQRVVAAGRHSPSVFRKARWIRGFWKPSRVRGTVTRVHVAGVLVHWVASTHLGGTNIQPPAWQPDPENNLALFPYPASEASVWYVGDRCFLRTTAGVVVVDDEESSSARRRAPNGRLTRINKRRRRPADPLLQRERREWERPMSVAGTRTTVDVLWQDGTRQCGVPSPSLVLFNKARNDYDFFPGQRVISKQTPAGRCGVVRSLNCRDKTVSVSWLPDIIEEEEDAHGGCGESETVVSAYDVALDSAAYFFYGDIVVRLRDPAEITTNHDLSWVGHVVDLCDGTHIHVKWGDGDTSKVLPREIVVVQQPRITEVIHELGDWQQEQGESTAQEPAAAAINSSVQGDHDSSDDESDTQDRAAVTTTMTAMDRVHSAALALIRNIFITLGIWNRPEAVMAQESAGLESPAVAMEDVPEAATLMSGGDADVSTSKTCEVKAGHDFPRFDVVRSPPDHHFIDTMQQGSPVGRKWTKRVQKEWKILENDLPDTIYVRAFEDRMDLLRVVMVGAGGTPYHDGLFFFDMHLTPSYPVEPPLVNYRSFGLRVNPNLYPSGTVCLSLLNTFGGEGAELWSPEASNILQVVVSIQGLVLTAQPYYNEPAFGAHAGTTKGLRNELPYSENTYLLNLQTMLHLLRRPPVGFEEFVKDHFRCRGQHVTRACEAYQDGCLVGTLDDEGHPTKDSKKQPCSVGFKLALLSILPRLVEALANIGAQGCKPS